MKTKKSIVSSMIVRIIIKYKQDCKPAVDYEPGDGCQGSRGCQDYTIKIINKMKISTKQHFDKNDISTKTTFWQKRHFDKNDFWPKRHFVQHDISFGVNFSAILGAFIKKIIFFAGQIHTQTDRQTDRHREQK